MPDLHLVTDHAHPDDSDLTALGQLRADVPPAGDDALTAARRRLTAAMDGTPLVATRAPRHARYGRRAVVGVAAAVALGLGAYALTGQNPSSPNPSSPGLSGPSIRAVGPTAAPSASTSPAPAPHYVSAAQLLDAASVAALHDVVPDGEYAHTSTHSYDITTVEEPPDNGAYEFSENRSERWQPADADDPGYEHDITDISVTAPTAQQRRFLADAPGGLPERSDDWYRVAPDGSQTWIYPSGGGDPACVGDSCVSLQVWGGPTPQLTAALPTDAAALRTNLFAWADAQHSDAAKYGKPTTVAAIALNGVGSVLGSGYASPALRSALFEVAKTIPGITLNGSMTNYDGVRGLAVSTTDPFDVQQNLIFSTDGSNYIGERDVVVHPSAEYHLEPGTVITWTAVATDVTGKPTLPPGADTGH